MDEWPELADLRCSFGFGDESAGIQSWSALTTGLLSSVSIAMRNGP